MTEEAIEILKEHYIRHNYYDNETISKATITVLNLIQKQQEEIEMYKDIKRIAETQVTELADFIDYKGKLEFKDKIIDLMAEEICFKEPLKYTTAQEVKQYFAKKAEEGE